ncbi:MAG: alpha/beta hydrolase [Terracidiphilus sp.]
MTHFLDCRMQPVGGELSQIVAVNQGTSINDYTGLSMGDFLNAIHGQHVLIATHGFNVNRQDGIACLSNWEGLLQLPIGSAFVGLLWPGDSVWAHGLDYPAEPKVADDAGALIAEFLDTTFTGVASVSFASHSLGARVVLSTVLKMTMPVRRLTLMAGAVDDNCLNKEFQEVVDKVDEISLLSSSKDEVLSLAFPMGNFFAGIIDAGHPWWHAAIGHAGASTPWPSNLQAPYMIPDNWDYQHGDYLLIKDPPQPPPAALPIPMGVPPKGSPEPGYEDGNVPAGWQSAFSAAFVSTRFR